MSLWHRLVAYSDSLARRSSPDGFIDSEIIKLGYNGVVDPQAGYMEAG